MNLDLPESEYRFDRVPEREWKRCFDYELFRTRIPSFHSDILKSAELVNDFSERLELQNQLDQLKRYTRPWLQLSKTEKTAFTHEELEVSEPVQLASELRGLDRIRLRKKLETVEITIDWSAADSQLSESFLGLIRRMRQKNGKAPTPKRGRPAWTPEMKLFSLAVWRCSQCDMSYPKIWDFLTPVRKKFGIGHRNRRDLSWYSRRIERLISP